MITSATQKSLKELKCCGIWCDFFDRKHISDSFKLLTIKRLHDRHIFLWILLFAILFYRFPVDEHNYVFLYTTMTFGWNIESFSNFGTFRSIMNILMVSIGIPILTEFFKLRDSTATIIATIGFTASRFVYAFAKIPSTFYVGAVIGSMGSIAAPTLTAMASKVIPIPERGKVFVFISAVTEGVPMISSISYALVYELTIGKFAGIFFLTIFTQIILIFLMM